MGEQHLDVLSIGETLIDRISDTEQGSLTESRSFYMYPGGQATNVALNVYHLHAYRYQIEQGEVPYWLPAFSPRGYAIYFDGLAHALALLTDLGDDDQRAQAEQFVQSLEQQLGSALLPAFWPVIQPGDPGWEAL